MEDHDTDERATAAVDLSKGEARVVIAALAEEQMTVSGERERRMRNVQDHLAEEFDFDEYRNRDTGEMAGEDEGWFDNEWFDDDILGDDEESVELSQEEADDVTAALTAFELDEDHDNAGAAEDVRQRIVDAFDEESDDD